MLNEQQHAAGRVLVLKTQAFTTLGLAGSSLLAAVLLLVLQQRILAADFLIMTGLMVLLGGGCHMFYRSAAFDFQAKYGATYASVLAQR